MNRAPMIHLLLQFPGGRYHATPWDHHVNEAVAEWPPHPLRILRALVAALHERCPELDRDLARAALRKLTAPPSYTLPPGTASHTRHYLSKNELDRSATALAFDSFVSLGSEAKVWIHWPADLPLAERRALAALAAAVSYLGRAESWCEMMLVDDSTYAPQPNCWPLLKGAVREGGEVARVLCPAADLLPEHLEQSTAEIQKKGYAEPPGTCWVIYQMPGGSIHRRERPTSRAIRPQVAEFALGGPVLPLFTEAVRVAELFRRAALKLHGTPSVTLSGKDREGYPLQTSHQHAHYLADCRDGSRRVTHIFVYAPWGFTEQEQRALEGIRFLPWRLFEDADQVLRGQQDVGRHLGPPPPERRDAGSLDVVLCAWGAPDDFGGSTLFGKGREWRSRTPFVLPRHVKRNRDQPEQQILRELSQREHLRSYCEGVEVKPISGVSLGSSAEIGWREFRRWRFNEAGERGFGGFVLQFRHEVAGPVLLGYGSHYGLGQFHVHGTEPCCGGDR